MTPLPTPEPDSELGRQLQHIRDDVRALDAYLTGEPIRNHLPDEPLDLLVTYLHWWADQSDKPVTIDRLNTIVLTCLTDFNTATSHFLVERKQFLEHSPPPSLRISDLTPRTPTPEPT